MIITNVCMVLAVLELHRLCGQTFYGMQQMTSCHDITTSNYNYRCGKPTSKQKLPTPRLRKANQGNDLYWHFTGHTSANCFIRLTPLQPHN